MRLTPLPVISLIVALTLAGCGDASEPASGPQAAAAIPQVATPAATASRIRIQGLGLDITDATGATANVPFERTTQAAAIAAVTAATGATPELTTNNDCPSGPTNFADYPNGLQLVFVDGAFQGWTLDQPGIYTENEFGVGVGRAVLDTLPDFQIDTTSTLGVEFYFQGVNGFMTSNAPDGVVESLYAGLTCFFR